MNKNGNASAVLARHDYLPFGEEIAAGVGRSATPGYGATDTNRQKYGLTERDDTTGLDHTWFRKYENVSGRFTSPDPYNGSASVGDPQTFNRFSYTLNDPTNGIDPTGLGTCHDSLGNAYPCSDEDEQWQRDNAEAVANAIRTRTLASLFDNYYLPAWLSGRSPMIIGLLPGPPSTPMISPNTSPPPPENKATICPPVQFKVTSIAPGQAPGKTAISQQERADIRDGGVAIKPGNFGVRGINGDNRGVFLNMRFIVDWSTAKPAGAPSGIPTEGPFQPVDNIGPASVRNAPGNQIDVYNYKSKKDALTSTRTVMVTAIIPVNKAGVACPQ